MTRLGGQMRGTLSAVLLLCCACQKQEAHHAHVAPTVVAPSCPAQPPEVDAQAVDRMRQLILDVAAPQPGEVVADIGTGGGWFTTRVARRVGKSGAVFGTDIDAATLDNLRKAPAGEDDAPVRFTLVHGERETGLDDLPPNHLDLLLMVDSLCFDQRVPRLVNIAYLQRFLRVMKPRGRLIHHMDCTCATTVAEAEALFVAAGFVPQDRVTALPCSALSTAACPTAAAQDRARFLGVFRKSP